jgi:uncharacterized membrane protein YkvA (DUF1232 family)
MKAAPLVPSRSRSLLPVFLRPRAVLRFLRDARASRSSKLLFLAAVIYAVLPVDLIPDVAPVIGWLDDAGFLTATVAWAFNRVSKYEREHPAEEPKAR